MLRSTILYLSSTVALYLLLLLTSFSKNDFLQILLYVFSYILPFFICLSLKKEAWKNTTFRPLSFTRRTCRITLFSFPFVFGCVLLCSLLASALTALSGTQLDTMTLTPLTFVRHAVLTAALEELFFRLLPLILFQGEQRRAALLLCTVPFALFHMSGYRFLYAAVAAVAFFLVDLCCDSLLPSFLMHIAVNTLSLLYTAICDKQVACVLFFCLTALAFSASTVWLFFRRSAVKNVLKNKLYFT